MKKLILSAVLALTAMSAQATKLSFYFTVNSSGPSLYACNAGIQHAQPESNVCYKKNKDQLEACNPNACKEVDENGKGVACNCVCTGDGDTNTNSGEIYPDYLLATYTDWQENGVHTATGDKKGLKATTSMQSLFSDADAFEKTLLGLEFNFGSETFGAKYFVDVCYRGPQIDFYAAYQEAGDIFGGNVFSISTGATVTDLTNKKYSELSGLKVRSEVVCDLQGKGSEVYAYEDGEYLGVKSTDRDLNASKNYVSFSNLSGVDNLVKTSTPVRFSPRFCKMRYYFYESNAPTSVTDVDSLRPWEKQKANVCTYTKVDDPAEDM